MTRYKAVPAPPDSMDRLREVQAAVPLVPGSVEDCCRRVVDRTAVPSRDRAREWLTFLRALGLVRETSAGYVRTDADADRESLATAFRDRVYGARELLDALDDGPLDAEAAFEALAPAVPEWERRRHGDWRTEWRERAARLLGWAALFGLAERTDAGYRAA